jgi:XTP/dITP diphosphohydrolase
MGAQAVTTVAYCDTRRIYTFDASQPGQIADKPKGKRRFQWDTIFMPEGHSITYAQMKIVEKNAISQRGEALRSMFEHIVKNHR